MAVSLTINGVSYNFPQTGEEEWGGDVTSWAQAITSGMLQKAGGTFTLTAEIDFGASHGIKSVYLKSRATNPSSSGQVRLGNAESVSWRNAGNTADLALKANASDKIEFNSVELVDLSGAQTLSSKTIVAASNTITTAASGSLTSTELNAALAEIQTDATQALADASSAQTDATQALADAAAAQADATQALSDAAIAQISANSAQFDANTAQSLAVNAEAAASVAQSEIDDHEALTAAHGTTGDVVGTSDPQTLSSKTFSDAITLAEITTPATPASGYGKVYFKDGKAYQLNDEGTESEIGAGGGSAGVNYIEGGENPGPSDISSWTVYANTTAGEVPDDFGGTASGGVTFTRNTTSPLSGDADFKLSKDAANRQGEGVYYEFSLELADRAKTLAMIGEALTSANYSDGDVTFHLVGSSDDFASDLQVVQGAPHELLASLSLSGEYLSEAQLPSTSTKARFCIHVASTSALDWTIQLTRLSVGPQLKSIGAYVGVRKSYTPSSSWAANATHTGTWKQVTDCIDLDIHLDFTSTPAGTLTFTESELFNGLGFKLDTDKIPGYAVGDNSIAIGTWSGLDSGTQIYGGEVRLFEASGSPAVALVVSAAGTVISTIPYTFNSGDKVGIKIRGLPIQGWSGTQVLSSEASRRTVACSIHTSSVANASTYNLGAATIDTLGGWNGTDTYTVKVSGIYRISAQLQFNITASAGQYYNLALYVDGSSYLVQTKRANGGAMVSDSFTFEPVLVELNAGQTIKLGTVGTNYSAVTASTDASWFNIELVNSGSQQIAASDDISARYTSGVAQTIAASGGGTIVDFETKDWDSHGAVTIGSDWKFTAPEPGEYEITCRIRYQNGLSWSAGGYAGIGLYPSPLAGGASAIFGEVSFETTHTPGTSGPSNFGSVKVKLLAGESAHVKALQGEGTTRALLASTAHNWIEVKRVGNY